jgi:processive 1,2-diacylglycerol beta-glucosyltransferase
VDVTGAQDLAPPDELADFVDWLPRHHDATLAMRPDVMILAARYGDGHIRAAKALALELLWRFPDIRVGLLDYYAFVSPRLDYTIRWAYLSSVQKAPWLWRWFYLSTQHIDPESTTQALLNRIGIQRFFEAVSPNPPKVIISTYPTAAGVVATLKRRGRLHLHNFVVMTDYSVHSQWIHRGVDRYFVGCQDMVDEMRGRGIDPGMVEVTGIPVDGRFQMPVDRRRVLASMGLPDQPTVLCMGGSYLSQSKFVRVLEELARIPWPHNLIIGAGREPARLRAAQEMARQAKHPTVALGYVDNVHELMAASDLMVSKAGGLTVTEALCRGLPVIVYRQIPGQEDANAEFLVRHGAGVIAHNPKGLSTLVSDLLRHPAQLKRMARQARDLGRPLAAQTVADRVAEALERPRVHAPV